MKKKLGSGASQNPEAFASDSIANDVGEAAPHPPTLPHPDEDRVVEVESEISRPARSVAVAATAAAEPAITVAEVREVIHITTASKFLGKSREEIAAIKIQTAFRGHLVSELNYLCTKVKLLEE